MTKTNGTWASTAAEWRQRSIHRIECPSGARILLRLLSVGELLTAGGLPDDLQKVALEEWAAADAHQPSPTVQAAAAAYEELPAKPTRKQETAADTRARGLVEQLAAVNRHIVAAALVEPKLTADELADASFPYADLEMLAGILQRRVSFDAAGRRIGVEPLDTFRVFAEEHGCDPGCEHCESARRQLSSVHVDAL